MLSLLLKLLGLHIWKATLHVQKAFMQFKMNVLKSWLILKTRR